MITLRRSEERGRFDFGWLDTRHTFSFGDYDDPRHRGFGPLMVLNQDLLQPGHGFGTHAHQDVDILSYVIEGVLEHRDALGNAVRLRSGDVQLVSAGTGLAHSEHNPSLERPVHVLQMWVQPSETGTDPRYEERPFSYRGRRGSLEVIASPDGRGDSVVLHSDVVVYAGQFEDGDTLVHATNPHRRGWIHVARGELFVNTTHLRAGDGAAVSELEMLRLEARGEAQFVLIDLP